MWWLDFERVFRPVTEAVDRATSAPEDALAVGVVHDCLVPIVLRDGTVSAEVSVADCVVRPTALLATCYKHTLFPFRRVLSDLFVIVPDVV